MIRGTGSMLSVYLLFIYICYQNIIHPQSKYYIKVLYNIHLYIYNILYDDEMIVVYTYIFCNNNLTPYRYSNLRLFQYKLYEVWYIYKYICATMKIKNHIIRYHKFTTHKYTKHCIILYKLLNIYLYKYYIESIYFTILQF